MKKLLRARVRGLIIIFVCLAAIAFIGALLGISAVGSETVADLTVADGGKCDDYVKVNASDTVFGDVTNVVIFICFADDSVSAVQASANEKLINYYIGEDNSLKDYYSTISYGKINIDTIFPKLGADYFVYQAPNSRSYYAAIKKSASASKRKREESTLLNGAINAANGYFDYRGVNLDVNSDGVADSVSFLVSGICDMNDSAAWGGLLWPHSANLADYSKDAGVTAKLLNGVAVGSFSFNFMGSVDAGLVCHETGHVLGMPDLYHYDRDTNYISVGAWDLMHSQNSVPQYPTVHMRDRYLNAIGDNQIINIKASGTYGLKPVSVADGDDAVACKLVINEKESIWMEYRNNSVSTYDSELAASGLLVYRVNTSVSGNEKGGHNKWLYPDEVYIYRPSVSTDANVRKREEANLEYAALSVNNENFRSLGGAEYGNNYATNAIYLTDGRNTGVKVEIISQTDDEIVFRVDANGYGSTEVVDMKVENEPVINYGETPYITLKIKLKGYDGYVTADPNDYVVEYDPQKIGKQTARAVYTDEEGNKIACAFTLTINDKVSVNGMQVETAPKKVSYNVGEEIELDGLSVRVRYESGNSVTVKYDTSNSSQWKIEGVDTSVSGDYDLKITYVPFDAVVFVKIKVLTELQSIRISEKDTTTVVDENGSLVLTVEGVNADGTVREMTVAELDISSINCTDANLYKAQTVTVRSIERPELSCTKTIYAVRTAELYEIVRKTTPNGVFRYGRELNLDDGILTLKFENGFSIDVPMNNYYSLYAADFSPVKRGSQALRADIWNCYDVFNVTVLAPDNGILVAANGISVDVENGRVLMEATTVDEAEEIFSSYLNIRFVCRDGDMSYEVSSRTHSGTRLNSSFVIELTNDYGQTVRNLRVYIRGDANGDGVSDEKDVDGWANALFRNSAESAYYLDVNGDGKYTLTDFVLLNERYCA